MPPRHPPFVCIFRLLLPGAAVLATITAAPAAAGDAAASIGTAVTTVYEPAPGAIENDVRAVARSAGGTLLVGSNVLAAFDGYHWQRIEVAGAYAFRALAAAPAPDTNRVWVGAIGTMGFVEPDAAGVWRYTSLLPQLAAAGLAVVRDVWNVRPLGHGAVWVTDEKACRWTPAANGAAARFDVWSLPARSRLSAFGGGERVWVYQEGTGLWQFTAGAAPVLILREADLPQTPVNWLVAANAPAPRLILGLNDAAYSRAGSGRPVRDSVLSDALKGSHPTDAVSLPDGRIAISTFDRGILIAGNADEPPQRFSTDRGLPEASVYSLLADGNDLWLASPQGLARVDGAGRATFFETHEALLDGRALDVLSDGNDVFVLTTHDLLRQSPHAPHALEPVLHAPDAFTDAIARDGKLWAAGLGGLWQVAADTSRQEVFAPNDILRVCETSRHSGGRLFLEGYAVKLLLPSEHGGWSSHDLGATVVDSPVSLLEDSQGDVWVSTMRQGAVRFRWQVTPPGSPVRLQIGKAYRAGAGLPSKAGRVQLVTLAGRLFAFTDAGILALRPDGSAFDAVPSLSVFDGVGASRPITTAPQSAYWLVRTKSLAGSGLRAVLRVTANARSDPVFEEIQVPGLDSVGAATHIAFAAHSLWVGGRRGLLRVDASALRPAEPPATPSLQVSHDDAVPGSRVFAFATPAFVAAEPRLYQSRLLGTGSAWSNATGEPTRQFAGLRPDHYRFEVRAVDRFGRASPPAVHEFVVLAPWWQTAPAFAAYAGFVVLAVGGAARWRLVRLRRQNERLNRLVAERTREIELASTAKSEFLDNVSHEIRNPLNGLSGLLALLKDERLGPREREIMRSLKSVAATLTQVFEEVLQYSKLEYGYGRIDRRDFALQPALEEVISLFAEPARQAGCTLALHWPPELADGFAGDPGKIKTVVANFVGNALKYAPGAPVDLRVGCGGEADGLVSLYIEVIDRGPGIPPEEQELIFRKFVRGRRARESEIPGTGLGLATCHMLAKLMNGSVGLDSVSGRGSTFHLDLALPRAARAGGHALPDETSFADEPVGTILIVDDEPYNRLVLEGVARELGATAVSVSSGKEALARLARDRFAVVLLDWELPDCNGGEVARALRAGPHGSRPVVLATTAHDSDEMRRRCRAAGMDGFLAKPYSTAGVRKAIAAARTTRDGPSFANADTADGDDPLDLSAFEHFARAHPGQGSTAWERFGEEIDRHLGTIAAAFATRDAGAVSREAHRLRALSGLVRAMALNRAAAQLEQNARRGTLDHSQSAWRATRAASDELKRRLAALAPPVSGLPPAERG